MPSVTEPVEIEVRRHDCKSVQWVELTVERPLVVGDGATIEKALEALEWQIFAEHALDTRAKRRPFAQCGSVDSLPDIAALLEHRPRQTVTVSLHPTVAAAFREAMRRDDQNASENRLAGPS